MGAILFRCQFSLLRDGISGLWEGFCHFAAAPAAAATAVTWGFLKGKGKKGENKIKGSSGIQFWDF